jgi:hypothetical protein
MSQDVHILTFPIVGGTHTAGLGTIPIVGSALLFKAPSDANGGGITILEAGLYARGAGMGTFSLLNVPGATPGTGATFAGTIVAAWGTSTIAAGTAYAFTISNGWVDGGQHVMLAQTGSLVVPGGNIYINYVMGRAAS